MKKVFIILFLFNILLYSQTLDESLFLAVENNNIEEVKSYLSKGANLNARDEYGITVLMYAAVSGNYEMVKFLLENGANINTKDNDGNTVLYYNIYYDHYGEEEKLENAKKIFNLLIKYGADVNTKDNDGASLLNKSYRASTALA
ncbi:ankyrin repeat domain-containing protein, partial [Brachyspira hyodysenteriae]